MREAFQALYWRGREKFRSSPFVDPRNPVLRTKSRELTVDEILSQETQDLIDDMLQIVSGRQKNLYQQTAVGLSHVQTAKKGNPLAIAIIDQGATGKTLTDKESLGKFLVLINPKRVGISDETEAGIESCLSRDRNAIGSLPRPRALMVEAFDREGNRFTKVFTGYQARIVAHELDHIEGILFPDRIDNPEDLFIVHDGEQRRLQKVTRLFGDFDLWPRRATLQQLERVQKGGKYDKASVRRYHATHPAGPEYELFPNYMPADDF